MAHEIFAIDGNKEYVDLAKVTDIDMSKFISTGSASLAGDAPSWHGLETQVERTGIAALDALAVLERAVGTGWDIGTAVAGAMINDEFVPSDDGHFLVRTWDDGSPSHLVPAWKTVSSGYSVIPMEDIRTDVEAVATALADAGKSPTGIFATGLFERVADLNVCFDLPTFTIITPDGVSEVNNHFLTLTHSIGRSAATVSSGMTRVVCANTQRIMLKAAEQLLKTSPTLVSTLVGQYATNNRGDAAGRVVHRGNATENFRWVLSAVLRELQLVDNYQALVTDFASANIELRQFMTALTESAEYVLGTPEGKVAIERRSDLLGAVTAEWWVESERSGSTLWSAANALTGFTTRRTVAIPTKSSALDVGWMNARGFGNVTNSQTQKGDALVIDTLTRLGQLVG